MGKRGTKPIDPSVRFWPKVDKDGPNGCWLWLGHRKEKGHGTFWAGKGKSTQAHRFAYESLVGPISDGLQIDHLCRNPPCVNPAHMEPVTRAENLRRGNHRGPADGSGAARHQREKTHCPRGHPYSGENTYSPPSRPTARYCRQCHLEHTRERRSRIYDRRR